MNRTRWRTLRVALTTLVVTVGVATYGAPTAAADTVGTNISPRTRLLIDTDLFSDVDDVGALATAFALEDRGEARVLGIGINTRLDRPAVNDASPRCAAAIAQFYGRPHLPIGSSRPLHGTERNPVDFITPCAARAAASTRAPQPVVGMYRRILTRQPNHRVVFVSLGYLSNLADLLASPPDSISHLTGAQLVARKVSRLVVMGGGYPTRSGENNFNGDPGAAAAVAANWPGPVVWDGYEVGDAVHTGQTISSTHPATSPVRSAYEAFVGPGNWIYSYDLTAVYHAVRPGDDALTEVGPGVNTVAANGSNRFQPSSGAEQHYLRLNDISGLDGSIEGLLDDVPAP